MAGSLTVCSCYRRARNIYRRHDLYTEASEFIAGNLPAGNYTFVLSDSCGAASSQQFVTIGELPVPTVNNTALANLIILNPDCNTLNMPAPPLGLNSPFMPYGVPGSGFTFGVALPGNVPAEYKDVYYTNRISLDLPAGQTLKDIYGQTVNYYLKAPCGEITILPYVIPERTLGFSVVKNCNISFGITAYSMNTVCLPVIIKGKNRATLQEYSDTAYDYNDWSLHWVTIWQLRFHLHIRRRRSVALRYKLYRDGGRSGHQIHRVV